MNKKLMLILSLLYIGVTQAKVEGPLLLIKIPTRSRPEQFFKRLDIFYKKLSGKIPVEFLITCDLDDQTMNNYSVRERLKKYQNLHVYFGANKSKIDAYNADLEKHHFDILLAASDDMEVLADGYDLIIVKKMQSAFPDLDGVLNFNDGHLGAHLNTMPVIGKKYYDRFGYMYNPEYIAFYCDNELTKISRDLGKELICHEVIIAHRHCMWGEAEFDALYQHNNSFFETDKKTYARRLAKNFNLNQAGIS